MILYSYGTYYLKHDPNNIGYARFNRITKTIKFRLWKQGEHNHKKDFYHKFGEGHIVIFNNKEIIT